jgi:hypothetical protein
VDLDGTLAMYDSSADPGHIGKPIPLMVQRVKAWINDGYEVRIFTARACRASYRSERERSDVILLIQDWCMQHIGYRLEVTNEKDFRMIELYDDRCVQVQPNTGMLVHEFWRHVNDGAFIAADWTPSSTARKKT